VNILENIQFLCKKNDMSIPKLEKELNIGNGAIYKWDKSSPSIDKLQKVADYFKVSTDYLLYGFDKVNFSLYTNYARLRRSINEFANDTGIDEYDQNGIPVIELTDTEFKCGWYASEWDTIWEYSVESIDVNSNTVKILIVKEDYTKEIFTLHLDKVGEKNYLTVHDEAGNETSWSPSVY
jgi:transcriptional regulator with XRE-family HTH domain